MERFAILPNFLPGDESGVIEADETVDPKGCFWWPSEMLDPLRYPHYASLRGRVFLPYVMVEEDGILRRRFIKESSHSWNAICEALKNDDNW